MKPRRSRCGGASTCVRATIYLITYPRRSYVSRAKRTRDLSLNVRTRPATCLRTVITRLRLMTKRSFVTVGDARTRTTRKKRQRLPFQAFEGDEWEMEEANKRASKREWKMQRKKWLNKECFQTPCMKMQLLGVLFQFYGHLYYLCPLCASPTVFDPLTFGEHGLHCGQCTKKNRDSTFAVSCATCSEARPSGIVLPT